MLDRRILWYLGTLFRRRYAKISVSSYLGPTLFVKASRSSLSIGDRVRIMAGARLEILGKGYIKINKNTSIGHSITCSCTNEPISIGANCVISGNVFIGTQNYDFKRQRSESNWFHESEYEASVIIGDNTFIGYGAVILGGTIIGANSTINAQAVVRGIFPENSVIKR